MTNKEKIDRIKAIEAEQLPLLESLKILDDSIRNLSHLSSEYLIAREIYDQHGIEMKTLVLEKITLLVGLGFIPSDGLIDESIKNTDMWKSLENDVTEIIMASEETSNLRYSLCTNCPEFVTISKQCKPLGVFAEEYSLIESSSCPIGKW
jgi:hypothetical protein